MVEGITKDSTSVFVGKVVVIPQVENLSSDLLSLIVKVVKVLVNGLETSDLFTISIVVVPFLISTFNKLISICGLVSFSSRYTITIKVIDRTV